MKPKMILRGMMGGLSNPVFNGALLLTVVSIRLKGNANQSTHSFVVIHEILRKDVDERIQRVRSDDTEPAGYV